MAVGRLHDESLCLNVHLTDMTVRQYSLTVMGSLYTPTVAAGIACRQDHVL